MGNCNIKDFYNLKDGEVLNFSHASCAKYKYKMNNIIFTPYSKRIEDGDVVSYVGMVYKIKKCISKKGNIFILLTLKCREEEIEIFLFEEHIITLYKLDLDISVVFKIKISIADDGDTHMFKIYEINSLT